MRWLLPAALSLAVLLLALPAAEPFTRLWLEQLWPASFTGWQWLQRTVPFPLYPLLLGAALLGLILPPLLSRPGRRLSNTLYSLALLLSGGVLWLQLGWGLNYQREPLPLQLGLTGSSSLEQRRELAAYLLDVLETDGAAAAEVEVALEAGRDSLSQLLTGIGYPGPITATVRQLPAGTLLGIGVSGMLFPFTLEALLDRGLPEWQQVSIGIHELAHVAGVADEADATLAAAIAGLRSTDGYARYASALDAWSRLELPPAERAELQARWPARASADLAAARAAGRRYRLDFLADSQAALLNWWLRLQGSEAGVADYSLGASRLPLALEAGLLP